MRLIVNGEERSFNPESYENFGQLLSEIEKENEGKVLSRLVINGKEIPLSQIDRLRDARIDEGVESIEMEFEPLRKFLVKTLEEVVKYVENVIKLLPKVSEDMVVDSSKGYRSVKDLTEGLSAVESLRENTMKISGITPGDVGISDREGEVAQILKDFVDNLERRDIIELSDLIERELPKVLEYYRDYFSKVLEILKERES